MVIVLELCLVIVKKKREFETQIIPIKKNPIFSNNPPTSKPTVVLKNASHYKNMKINKLKAELIANKPHDYKTSLKNNATSRARKRISRSSILGNPEHSGPTTSVMSGAKSKMNSQDMESNYSPNIKFQYRINNHHMNTVHKKTLRDLSTGMVRNQNNPLAMSKDTSSAVNNQNHNTQSKSLYNKADIKQRASKLENNDFKTKISNVVSRTDTGLNLTNLESNLPLTHICKYRKEHP